MIKDEWLKDKIAYLKGLKTVNQQQELMLLLAEKPVRDAKEEKTLNALIRAEKATDRANKARQEAMNMIRAEKKAEQDAIRKARTHAMIQSAGLLGLAGLIDKETGQPTIDKAELLGALLGLASVPDDHPKRKEWKETGNALLSKVSSQD